MSREPRWGETISLPSQLPELEPHTWVAWDVESSGLHPDDGARVAVVSIAWIEEDELGPITHAHAYPFDAGLREGKAEYRGQEALDLFNESADGWVAPDKNLPHDEWIALFKWLVRQAQRCSGGRGLVAHNSPFDSRLCRTGTRMGWKGPDLMPHMVWDTAIAERELALEADALISLEASTRRRAIGWKGKTKAEEASAVKGYLKRNKLPAGRYDLVPWEIIEPYAASDAALTIRLAARQIESCDELDSCGGVYGADLVRPRIETQLDRQRALYNVESRGLPYDGAGSLAEAGKLLAVRAELIKQLPFAPTDGAAKAYWFGPRDKGGRALVPYSTTEGGRPQLDKESVNRLIRDGVKHADIWQKVTQLDTAVSMWYAGYPAKLGPDGRLRQSFRITKVVSGRTSVERVNLQAIPHDYRLAGLPEGTRPVRSFIRLPDGSPDELWELDLAQAELRAAAKASRCDKMIELIYAGADLHGVTATELFNSSVSDPRWFEFRQVAKRANFSLIFDVGAATFKETLEKQLGIYWSLDECRQLIYRWHVLYDHKLKQAVYRAMRQVENRRWLRLSNGRIRRFSDREVRFDSHKSFNAYVQGSLAEMTQDWVVAVDRTHPGITINFVHDSLTVQVPKGPQGEHILDSVENIGVSLFEQHFDIVGGVDRKRWGK